METGFRKIHQLELLIITALLVAVILCLADPVLEAMAYYL